MKSFCWNVRGLNGSTRKLAVKRWVLSNRPLIGGFLETHVAQNNIGSVLNEVVPGWNFSVNYSDEAENGRIVVAWDPLLAVIIYLKTPQLVLCGVTNPSSGQSFTVAFVYARNTREERFPLWSLIKELAAKPSVSNSPWLLLGDFNQVLSLSEAYSLHPFSISLRGMSDFQDCLR